MDSAVGLPAGFKLDAPAGDTGLPPGFKLDAPVAPRETPTAAAPDSKTDFVSGNLNKGIAGIAGLPVDTMRNLMNIGIAIHGSMMPAGALGGGGSAREPLQPGPGSSQWFEQLMRKGGLVNAASDPTSKAGEYGAAALQAIPGAAMGRPTNPVQAVRAGGAAATGGVTGQAAADVGGEEWRAVGGMAPGAAKMQQKPAGEAATAARQAEAFGKAKDMGIPVPPRAMKVDKPQQSIQDQINAELRQPPGSPIDPATLQQYRNAHWQGYEAVIKSPALAKGVQPTPKFQKEIQDIGDEITKASGNLPQTFKGMQGVTKLLSEYGYGQLPQGVKGNVPPRAAAIPADVTMRAIKKLRNDATTNLTSDKPETVELGRVQRKVAMSLENLIEENLGGASGNQQLMQQFRDARTAIAKSHDVESSIDPVTRKVSGARLSQLLTEGRPLSGKLGELAEVSGAFPGAIKPPPVESDMFSKRMSPFGVTHPSSVVAHAGARMLDPLTLSRPYQSMFVDPRNKLSPEQERGLRYMLAAQQSNRGEIPPPPR